VARRKWPCLAARAAAITRHLAYIVQIPHRMALLRFKPLPWATPPSPSQCSKQVLCQIPSAHTAVAAAQLKWDDGRRNHPTPPLSQDLVWQLRPNLR
jgi:hypothetical protein